jgi:predicted Zn-dependent protease
MNAESKFGITGNDLMVDHLHPNIRGYQIIGQAFCSALVRNGILQSDRINLPDVKIDSALNAQFPFTSLDSVIADIRVRILTGSYPFVPKGQENLLIKNFKPALFRDTLAMRVIDKDITIEDAHYQLADIYYAEKNIDAFEKELLVVIADRPFNPYHYHKLIDGLVGANEAPRALPYLYTLDKLNSDYYTTKWIGGILLAQGDYQNALAYLEKSVIYNSSDPQAWYNLAGAYFYTSNMKKAMESAQNALKINPRYMEARAFYEQLKAFMGK